MVNEEIMSYVLIELMPYCIVSGFAIAVTFSLIMYGMGKALSLLHKLN